MRLTAILIAAVAFFGPSLTACGITDNSQTTTADTAPPTTVIPSPTLTTKLLVEPVPSPVYTVEPTLSTVYQPQFEANEEALEVYTVEPTLSTVYAATQTTILLPPTTQPLVAVIPPAPEFVLSPEDRRLAQEAAYPHPSSFSAAMNVSTCWSDMTMRFRDAVLDEPSRMPQEWFDYERRAGGNYEDGTTWGSQYDKHSMAVCVEAAADAIEAKDRQDDDDQETVIRLRRCAEQYMDITSFADAVRNRDWMLSEECRPGTLGDGFVFSEAFCTWGTRDNCRMWHGGYEEIVQEALKSEEEKLADRVKYRYQQRFDGNYCRNRVTEQGKEQCIDDLIETTCWEEFSVRTAAAEDCQTEVKATITDLGSTSWLEECSGWRLLC